MSVIYYIHMHYAYLVLHPDLLFYSSECELHHPHIVHVERRVRMQTRLPGMCSLAHLSSDLCSGEVHTCNLVSLAPSQDARLVKVQEAVHLVE